MVSDFDTTDVRVKSVCCRQAGMQLAAPPTSAINPSRHYSTNSLKRISKRVGRCLERQGLLERDAESAWLDLEPAEDTDAMPQILGSSVSYRVAVGPQQGRKAFMIRTIRPLDKPDPGLERVAKANGFSVHAGVSCEGHQKKKVRAGKARETALGHKRERLCLHQS